MAGLIVGNLDVEARWRAAAGLALELPERVMSGLAALATLLRVFAANGDLLWLPHPVEAERVLAVDGVPTPRLVSGSLPPAAAVLPWAVTAMAPRRPRLGGGKHWGFSPISPAIAMRVNGRRFGFEVARRAGSILPGAQWVSSVEGLEGALDGATEVSGGRWVLKPAWSAAGRDRLLGERPVLDPGERRRAATVIGTCGALLEPWVARVEDCGLRGLVTDRGVRLDGGHRLLVDGGGRFRGVEVTPRVWPAELRATAVLAGEALRDAGYRGHYVIDAFRWTVDGRARWQPLCEINARLSFGWVAAALVERLGWSEGVLRLSRKSPDEGAPVQLLAPSASCPWQAWLERPEPA